MAYGQGINARAAVAYETTYGTTPGSGFYLQPFVSTTLGEERPLLEDDTLGNGREGVDPTYDVATNDGDIVVPVDQVGMIMWLTMMMGGGVVSEDTPEDGQTQRVWTSGSTTLPSASIEIGMPDVPSYSTHYGVRANQMQIGMSRGGLLNATIGLIAQGQTAPITTSIAGTPTVQNSIRFAQATGQIQKGGVQLGGVTAATLTLSNGLDKIETIRPDGRIEGTMPGVFRASGSLTARFSSHDLLNAAIAGDPVVLFHGWARVGAALSFNFPRVFLPRPKTVIDGPRGIMATFNWQASGAGGHQVTATLIS